MTDEKPISEETLEDAEPANVQPEPEQAEEPTAPTPIQEEPPTPTTPTEPAPVPPVPPELKAQFPNVFKSEKRQYIEDFTAHFIAVIFSVGFFAIILAALLGFVDINDPTVSAFVGTAIGYAAGKIDPVLSRYFGSMTTTGPNQITGGKTHDSLWTNKPSGCAASYRRRRPLG